MNLTRRMAHWRRLVDVLGTLGAFKYVVGDRLYILFHRAVKSKAQPLEQIFIKTLGQTVWCRIFDSDRSLLRHIFVDEEYKPLKNIKDVKVIVDCGANVGYATAYLLKCHPCAMSLAIEPEKSNFELLERNLAAFGERAIAIKKGIWSKPANLKVDFSDDGDGLHWSAKVRECAEDEIPDVESVDIPSIIHMLDIDRIDILKIDIEGSELEIFTVDCSSWINKVRVIAIELHDENCRSAFHKAVQPYPHSIIEDGENTICTFLEQP